MTEGEKNDSNFASGAFETARVVAMTAANGGSGDGTKACVFAATATAGALTVVAEIVNKSTEPNKMITADEMLLAALLVACICPGVSGGDNGFGVVAWSPDVIHDAMKAFERVTGRSPEPFMNPQLVAMVSESEVNALHAWEQFKKERAAFLERGGKPLDS